MLDIKFIRDNKELVKKNSQDRLANVDVDLFLELDEERRSILADAEQLRAERNKLSKSKPTEEGIKQSKKISADLEKAEKGLEEVTRRWRALWLAIPNLTHPEVKTSSDENDNPVLEIVGKIPTFKFTPKDHVEITQKLDWLDFEKASRITGNKFYYIQNELVLINMALINYAMNIAVKHGFKPMITPDLAKTELIEGMGYNPRGESSQIYQVAGEDLSLIGTSEITLGGYHSEEILEEKSLPIKYVGLSHCFRTEAGSYSKFSKGIFRVHQFEKLELFVFCKPEEAEKIHHELLAVEKEIFKGLGIPFRVIDHCTADLGAPSYRTFDLEAWLPGKPNAQGGVGDWAEITSVSNCTDYQSRALNIKYTDKSGEKRLAYTFNGTAVAVPRALIAIIENYQNKDGSITIPKKLRPYLPFKKIKK